MSALLFTLQVPDSANTPQQVDTITSSDLQQQYTEPGTGDSAVGYFPALSPGVLRQHAKAVTIVPAIETSGDQQSSSSLKENRQEWNTNKNFFTENGLATVITPGKNQRQAASFAVNSGTLKPTEIVTHQRKLDAHGWLLGIFLFLTVLFIWIRIFYSKFFATLANSLISFQISAKLFKEKNVLLHRVSIVLDFIYIIVFSTFIFELITYYEFIHSTMSEFNFFLLLLNIVMLYSLFRIFLLRLTGILFLIQPIFSEYIHNTFVVNKGMGIALFPLVIMAHYFPDELVPVVLGLGVLILAIAFILKIIRAYQIIIRKDVLLFYLILYLCTLEILPLLLGYKFVTSLI
jgi:hypothetical protein